MDCKSQTFSLVYIVMEQVKQGKVQKFTLQSVRLKCRATFDGVHINPGVAFEYCSELIEFVHFVLKLLSLF